MYLTLVLHVFEQRINIAYIKSKILISFFRERDFINNTKLFLFT